MMENEMNDVGLTDEIYRDTKLQIDRSTEAGTKFSSVYYDMYDKNRHKIGKMYHDTAQLVWEGNAVQGRDSIQKFLQELPGCFHVLDWFDCQPILSQFTGGKETILVSAGGTVKYDDHPMRSFVQNFTLTNIDGTWKVISDSLRLRDT